MLTVVAGDGSGHEGGRDSSLSLIDEIVREGARRMLTSAGAVEVTAPRVNDHRTDPGPGSRAAGLAMVFKLIESAQARSRPVNAPHRVALVRAGAIFRDGVLAERLGQATE